MDKTGRVGGEEDMKAMGNPLPEKKELLATNTAAAEYKGTYYKPCRHIRRGIVSGSA